MPAQHCAMTNSGCAMMNSGAPIKGIRRFAKLGGKGICLSQYLNLYSLIPYEYSFAYNRA
jgi:hypothetical protein